MNWCATLSRRRRSAVNSDGQAGDGGGGALGHPKVYINLDRSGGGEGQVATCGYCGLRFKQGTDRRAEGEEGPAALTAAQGHRGVLMWWGALGSLRGATTRVIHRLFCSVKDGVTTFSKMFVRFTSHKK